MADKLSIYNLSELGVDVDKAPTHISDGEMLQAQNAMIDVAGNRGGIRKRLGMAKLNSVALGSPSQIQGVVNVNLDNPAIPTSPAGWYAFIGFGYKYSQDLVTWGARVVLTTMRASRGVQNVRRRILSISSEDTVYVFDGTEGILADAPPIEATTFDTEHLATVDGEVYVTYGLVSGTRMGVYRVDKSSGALTQMGGFFGTATGAIANRAPRLCWQALGRLWLYAAAAGGGGGNIYSHYLGEEDEWVSETTVDANLEVASAAEYQGNLYVFTYVQNGSDASLVMKRDLAGAWTTAETAPDTSADNRYGQSIKYNGSLYYQYRNTTGTARNQLRRLTDTTFSTPKDLAVEFTDAAGFIVQMFPFGSELILVLNNASIGNPTFYRMSTTEVITDGALLRDASGDVDAIGEVRN